MEVEILPPDDFDLMRRHAPYLVMPQEPCVADASQDDTAVILGVLEDYDINTAADLLRLLQRAQDIEAVFKYRADNGDADARAVLSALDMA